MESLCVCVLVCVLVCVCISVCVCTGLPSPSSHVYLSLFARPISLCLRSYPSTTHQSAAPRGTTRGEWVTGDAERKRNREMEGRRGGERGGRRGGGETFERLGTWSWHHSCVCQRVEQLWAYWMMEWRCGGTTEVTPTTTLLHYYSTTQVLFCRLTFITLASGEHLGRTPEVRRRRCGRSDCRLRRRVKTNEIQDGRVLTLDRDNNGHLLNFSHIFLFFFYGSICLLVKFNS